MGMMALMVAVALAAFGCGDGETIVEKEVPVVQTVIVEKEVAGETMIVEKEVQVIQTVVVTKEGETMIVEKEVPVIQTVVVTKEGETKIVEKEVPVIQTVVVQEVVIATPSVFEALALDRASDGRYGGTLRTVSQASIGGLDPFASSAWVVQAVAIHFYDQIFTADGNFVPQPQMVDTWSISDDGLVWTFTNRDNLIWQDDASPVTATDVKATLERAFPAWFTGWKELGSRATVGVIDDKTWTLNFQEPFGLVFDALNQNTEGFNIQKASIIEELGVVREGAVLQEHVGSGPYKFTSWDVGNRVVLDRFEAYVPRTDAPSGHAGAKYGFVDRIEIVEIPDVQTRLSLLETGEVDFIDTAPLDFFDIMQSNKEVNVYTDPVGRWPVMILNHTRPPFNDLKARQALQASIDMGSIMAAYGPPTLQGLCPAVYLCGLRWDTRIGEELYNQNDVPKAQALLAESAYDGRAVVAMTPVDQPTIHPILTVAEQNITAAGFDLDLQYVDWATLKSRRVVDTEWDIFTTWGATGYASPLTNTLGNGDFGGVDSAVTRDLREQFLSATSETEQESLIEQLQLAYYEEVPYIRIGFFSGIHAAGVWVRGFDPRALWPAYWNVWLDR